MMARRNSEQNVTQSVLERLIDRDRDSPTDSSVTHAQSVRQLKSSLRRDLEWLLNTRRTPEPAEENFGELPKSLFNYGLPDVTWVDHEAHNDRTRLVQLLETTIAHFEPRLTRVKVRPLEAVRGSQHVLGFQIDAMLMMDPEPEHVSF